MIEALAVAERLHALAPALTEAWERGSEWQRLIVQGAMKLGSSYLAINEGLGLPFAVERQADA